MKFTIITSLLAASGLTIAAPFETREATPATSSATALDARQASCPVTQQGDYTWKITDFTGRKPEGTFWSAFTFKLRSTNPGSSYVQTCSASDRSGLTERRWYECARNAGTWFSFDEEYSGLWIKYGDK